jgi:flagellin-like protein
MGRTFRRRRGRSGVSPIIAMILLVAIVVVLAAVLYVLVGGLVHTNASAVPLGTAFYAGPAGKFIGTTASKSYCEANHYCYSVPIDEVGKGLVIGNLNFRVLESTGAIHVVAANYAMIAIVDSTSAVIASTEVSKKASFVVTDWTTYSKGQSANTLVTDTQVIWVQFGSTSTSPFGEGMTLQVLGANGYSGSVSISLP